MGRKYDLIDVMAAIGLVATLFGGYFVVTATSGSWQQSGAAPASAQTPVGLEAGIQWLQPALGQAILDEQLLERDATRRLASSLSDLTRAQNDQQRLEDLSFSPLGVVDLNASAIEADHAARMQWVMGRSIVTATGRGIRGGILSAGQDFSDFNRQLIRTAESNGQRIHQAYEATHQQYLGESIVQAAREEERQLARNQERIGTAIVQLALAEEAYAEAGGMVQYQLATTAMAAVRSNAMYEAMGGGGAGDLIATAEERMWPDIPAGYVAAAFASLIAVFGGGMALVGRKPEEDALPVEKVETLQRLYRMTG